MLASIDGFYASVVQHLRPWSIKAPQLPRTPRTAVEEAGIDIEPPPKDLEESAGPETEPSPPEWTAEPAEVLEGVDDVLADTHPIDTQGTNAATEVSDELVSWDHAQDRLDHERSFDTGSEPSDPRAETPSSFRPRLPCPWTPSPRRGEVRGTLHASERLDDVDWLRARRETAGP